MSSCDKISPRNTKTGLQPPCRLSGFSRGPGFNYWCCLWGTILEITLDGFAKVVYGGFGVLSRRSQFLILVRWWFMGFTEYVWFGWDCDGVELIFYWFSACFWRLDVFVMRKCWRCFACMGFVMVCFSVFLIFYMGWMCKGWVF